MQIPVTGINSDLGSGKSIRNRMDSDPQHWLWECTVNVLSIIKLASDAVNYSAYLLPPGADSSGLEWSRNWKFILIPPEVSSVIFWFFYLLPPGADSSGLEWSRNWRFIFIPTEVSAIIS